MATRKSAARRASTRRPARSGDAITLLKGDHRQVEKWFKQFEKAGASQKSNLAKQICTALRIHTIIEEEIFYPSFLAQAKDEDIHHEAEVEHAGAKQLIAQIESASPGDEYFDAKVTVLSEMIKHHVREEEQPGGMFAKARGAKMDLKELGTRLAEKKAELEAQVAEGRKPAADDPSLEASALIQS
jgi:Hemerythrin HHE cation binding domain